MNYEFFKEARLARLARVPLRYRRQVRWLPRIGDLIPDLSVDSTQGPLRLHDWAKGRWLILFSHPAPFTAVCTTEIAALASLQAEFDARGARLLGVSTGSLDEQRRWHDVVRRLFGFEVTFPMVADEDGLLANLFGMIHEAQSPDRTIRKTFVVGPDLRLRAITEYPMSVGRSTDEALRLLDALQTAETFNLGVGADWQKGDECLVLPEAFGPPRFGAGAAARPLASYLQTVADPWTGAGAADDLPTRPAS